MKVGQINDYLQTQKLPIKVVQGAGIEPTL
jgi:hypothetical protein